MPGHATLNFDAEEIALTDRELFSLYLRYPEMPSDQQYHDECDPDRLPELVSSSSPASSPPSIIHHSSPPSNLTRCETPASSPLGPPDIIPFPAFMVNADEEEVDELTTQFDLALRSSHVPKDTAEYFAETKSIIINMGGVLFSASGDISANLQNVALVKSSTEWLILCLNQAHDAVGKEIRAIESMLCLAPFTVRPAVEDLWTNYKQMAELIIQ
jgi:hypothetical protein